MLSLRFLDPNPSRSRPDLSQVYLAVILEYLDAVLEVLGPILLDLECVLLLFFIYIYSILRGLMEYMVLNRSDSC